MKPLLPLVILMVSSISVNCQNQANLTEGAVSYITPDRVYVRFSSTTLIHEGDTLFIKNGVILIPALKVESLSSISCLCVPLSSLKITVSDKIYFMPGKRPVINQPEAPAPSPHEIIHVKETTAMSDTMRQNISAVKTKPNAVKGYISLVSYTDWSNNSSSNAQREKLTLSLSARNLGNSIVSGDCYISYYQDNRQRNETSNSLFNELKIYNLDLNFDFSKKVSLLFGRKINPNLSGMGANDGVQLEAKFKPIGFGVLAGFRPNICDYGFNVNEFQAGAYLFNEYIAGRRYMRTTLAVIDQTNGWITDRRFIYLQHYNALVKNLSFYGTAEMDIYGKTFNSADSTFKSKNTGNLTNLYLSLNYRILRKFSVSVSYSARKDIIYYETYKDYLDRLLDTRLLQGYILQVEYDPVSNLSLGATATYRFQQEDPDKTANLYGYISYNRIPGINTTVTASVVALGTSYIDGRIYSLGLSKDMAAGKLYLGLTYCYVDYKYHNTEYIPSYQNMGEFSLTLRIIRKLAFSAYYEGTFEKVNQFSHLYAQLNCGF